MSSESRKIHSHRNPSSASWACHTVNVNIHRFANISSLRKASICRRNSNFYNTPKCTFKICLASIISPLSTSVARIRLQCMLPEAFTFKVLILLTSPWCHDSFPNLWHPILPWALIPSRVNRLFAVLLLLISRCASRDPQHFSMPLGRACHQPGQVNSFSLNMSTITHDHVLQSLPLLPLENTGNPILNLVFLLLDT